MIKYCLIDSAITDDNSIPTGIRQWSAAFSGEILQPNVIGLPETLNKFDIIHIKLSPINYPIIESIRNSLGFNSSTKIMLSLDYASEDCSNIFENTDDLKDCCENADFIFATSHLSVQFLEKTISKKVYELYNPADFSKIERSSIFSKTITVLRKPSKNTALNNFFIKFLFLLIKIFNPKNLLKYKLKIISCPENWNAEFQNAISKSEFIFCPDEKMNFGENLLYAGAVGCKIFGTNNTDIIRRCFSLGGSESWLNHKNTLLWFLSSTDVTQFFLEHASEKMEYYNLYNSKKRLLNILKHEKLADDIECDFIQTDSARINYYAEMRIISGPKAVNLEPDDFAVVCLEKNGYEYLPSFLKHYRSLGAKHFFFIDNDSDDETVSLLSAQTDVTVYQTSLKHRKYESEIRRVIVDEHCKGAWCMCVDIDELFDFPYSNKISMKYLIEYLRANDFTSIVGYMLDMFSITENTNGIYLEDTYTHYDISNIKKADYYSAFQAFNNFNIITNKNVCLYYGGVRQAYIGKKAHGKFLLVKHPLFFVDHYIEPISMPHFCNKTKVADISCVLRHYKLTFSLKEKINNGVAKDDYSYMIKEQIDAYQHMTGNANTLIGSLNAQKYIGTDNLIANNFIQVTDNYKSFVSHKLQFPQ